VQIQRRHDAIRITGERGAKDGDIRMLLSRMRRRGKPQDSAEGKGALHASNITAAMAHAHGEIPQKEHERVWRTSSWPRSRPLYTGIRQR
jgi:hypothetical protein